MLATSPTSNATLVAPGQLRPSPTLASLHQQLQAVLAPADAATASWLHANAGHDRAAFTAFAVTQVGTPPSAATQADELDQLRQLQAARTIADTKVAAWYDHYGDSTLWRDYLKSWQATVSPDQARAGAQLLADALAIGKDGATTLKHEHARERPYMADPSLKVISSFGLDERSSFPSAHTAHSFAAAGVLGHLMPDRAGEFADAAEQVAFSRVYSNAHFPSDVVAGARLGRMAADWAIANDG